LLSENAPSTASPMPPSGQWVRGDDDPAGGAAARSVSAPIGLTE
jgi:hypothetical protein